MYDIFFWMKKRPLYYSPLFFFLLRRHKERDVPNNKLCSPNGVLHERQNDGVLGEHRHHNRRLKKRDRQTSEEEDLFYQHDDAKNNTSTERGQHSGKGEERLEGGRAKTREQFQREIRPVRVLG